MRGHVREGARDVERIRVLGRVGGLALKVFGHHRAGALRQACQLLRRDRRLGGLLLIGHLRILYNACAAPAAHRPGRRFACVSRLRKCI
jgi:hypothetical protein